MVVPFEPSVEVDVVPPYQTKYPPMLKSIGPSAATVVAICLIIVACGSISI